MQRLACLLILIAACGGGTKTEEASLIGAMPTVLSAATRPFTDVDGSGKMVLGWDVDLFDEKAGSGCSGLDEHIVATIAIYTSQAAGSAPHALITTPADIFIVQSTPTVTSGATATMSSVGLTNITGLVAISDFHLIDATHADRIKGTITAGAKNAAMADVDLIGNFSAPVCED